MYTLDDERVRRARGFILGLVGSFVFALSSVVVLDVTRQPEYAVVAGLSLGAILLSHFATRSHVFSLHILYMLSASATLAAEASFLILYIPEVLAGGYAFITLAGSFVAMRGIRELEYVLAREPVARRRREIPAVQSGV